MTEVRTKLRISEEEKQIIEKIVSCKKIKNRMKPRKTIYEKYKMIHNIQKGTA